MRICLAVIILLISGCKSSKKIIKESEVIDKSISSVDYSNIANKYYNNTLLIDTTKSGEIETTTKETNRTEVRDSAGNVKITENIKETKTRAKKEDKGVSLAKNDSVETEMTKRKERTKKDIEKKEKTKINKEVKTDNAWVWKILIIGAIGGIIWLNKKRIRKWLVKFFRG